MTDPTTGTDWRRLLTSWDRQQAGYIPGREQMFALMIDTVRTVLGARPRVLDLACGPGSISERLLARMPEARTVALDLDPALLAIGRGALGTLEGRLSWVEQDLADPDWTDAVAGPFDAVLTATALHWLSPEQLTVTYRRISAILRPGGLLLNADRMRFDNSPTCNTVSDALTQARDAAYFALTDAPDWDGWWRAMAEVPALAALVRQRNQLFPRRGKTPRLPRPTLAFHQHALADAGFSETDVLWQDLDRRLLLATSG